MYKVLIAEPDIKENSICCNYLATSNNNLKVFSTTNGIDTLNTYFQLQPNIMILNTEFKDVNGIEILDKISMSIDERHKCNTILTVNNDNEKLKIKNTSKVYKILSKPYELKELLEITQKMCLDYDFLQLDENDLDLYLLRLDFHNSSNGTNYMKSAIKLGFYFPKYLSSLDDTIKYIATKYNVKESSVKNALNSSLKPLNNDLIYSYNSKSLYRLFNGHKNVTAKHFIKTSVAYLKIKQYQKKK